MTKEQMTPEQIDRVIKDTIVGIYAYWPNEDVESMVDKMEAILSTNAALTQLIEAASRYHKLMNTPLYKADEDHHEQIQKANSDLSSALKPFEK